MAPLARGCDAQMVSHTAIYMRLSGLLKIDHCRVFNINANDVVNKMGIKYKCKLQRQQ